MWLKRMTLPTITGAFTHLLFNNTVKPLYNVHFRKKDWVPVDRGPLRRALKLWDLLP